MNIKEIKEMLKLMSENNLLELEMEKDGMKIRLKKESLCTANGVVPTQIVAAAPQYSVTHEAVAPQEEKKAASNLVEIKAPMVGTFYRSPAPEAPPFAEKGKEVDVGQVVCIIEAMKLMNEIKSEVKGKIVEVLMENGHPIEFGTPLFLVEPA
ncbi:acetyl-CoA carboxylase biotin carboxyl carrier protein [Thermoproteota archaeon]